MESAGAGTAGAFGAGAAGASEVVFPSRFIGMCSTECYDSLCLPNEECPSKHGKCKPVTCGRKISCPAADSALYCFIPNNSCHQEDGKCSANGVAYSDCPQLNGFPRPGVEAKCDTANSGSCRYFVHATPTPKLRVPN